MASLDLHKLYMASLSMRKTTSMFSMVVCVKKTAL